MNSLTYNDVFELIKDGDGGSGGVDRIEDLDELFKFWKEIFGEDITEW